MILSAICFYSRSINLPSANSNQARENKNKLSGDELIK